MRAVKLSTNKILHFLTGSAGQCRLTCIVAKNSFANLLRYGDSVANTVEKNSSIFFLI